MRLLCNCHTKFLVGIDKKAKNSTCIATSVLFISVHKQAKNCWLASTITQLSTSHPNSTPRGLLLTILLSLCLQDHRIILAGSNLRRFAVQPPTQKWSAVTLVTQGFIQSSLQNFQGSFTFSEKSMYIYKYDYFEKKAAVFSCLFPHCFSGLFPQISKLVTE